MASHRSWFKVLRLLGVDVVFSSLTQAYDSMHHFLLQLMGRKREPPRDASFLHILKERAGGRAVYTRGHLATTAMEDYQYMNGRGRSGLQFQSWGTGAGNGYEATDAWNRSSASSGLQLGGVGAGARDHVCRPVIVGSDGTTMPAVLECPPRYNNHHYNDGYGTNGFSGVGGNVARWEYGGDSYAFEKRNKPKDFLDHVHDAAMSGYGLSTPGNGNGFQRHKAGYGSYDAAAAGGAYGAGANGWGTMGSGWGAPAASHGATPLGMATTYIIETAAESLLDSKKPAASAYSGGNWESWNSSKAKNKKHGGSVSSIGKEAAKKYAGQFIW